MKRLRAFTLVELVCVISVCGIFFLIQYPSIEKMLESQRLSGCAKRLVSDLRYAKVLGISRNLPSVFVRFNGDSDKGIYTDYDIYYQRNSGGALLVKHYSLPENVIIDGWESTFATASGGTRLEFKSDGSVNPACTIVIKDIKNYRKKYITLTIGYTRIMEVKR